MRPFLSLAFIALVTSACAKEPTAPTAQTFHITATVAGATGCTVNAPDTVYHSVGNFSGDQPKKFVSTFDTYYHGFWCWVSVDGGKSEAAGAANLYVVFSGNTFGKPL